MKRSIVTGALALLLAAPSAAAQTASAEQAAQYVPPPPPPPGQEEHRLIEQASDLIARGRADDARRLLDRWLALTPAPAYSTLPVLQRLAARMSLQAPLAMAPAEAAPRAPRTERGSLELFELYSTSFLYGVGTGVYLDTLFKLDDPRTAVWIPLALGGGGIVAAYLIDHGDPVRRGRASSADTGMLLGFGLGFSLAYQVDQMMRDNARDDCAARPYPCYTSSRGLEGREVATFAWLGATVGLGAGVGLAALTDATPGESSFVFAGGVWGGALGVLTNAAGEANRSYGLAWLVGELAGVGASMVGAHFLHPAESQVRWMNLGVLAGGLLGLGVGVLPSRFESAPTVLIPTEIGMVAGGVAGFLLGAPSRGPSSPRSARVDRLRADPSIAPVQGGATVSLNFPNLL